MRTNWQAQRMMLLAALPSVSTIALDINNPDSVRSVASTIAFGLQSYYKGNITNTPETIALLPQPHYWWQAGAMWGLMLDYYHFTGDDSYSDVTTQALASQVGPNSDFMVPLQYDNEANDDQAFWGFSSMSAAEKGYREPPGEYTWLQLTERLWNTQVRRWDVSSCGGGLKWQIFPNMKGYHYKNSISNGAFFQLSARLARFTGNRTYYDWASRAFEWEEQVGLISQYYNVYDGTDSLINCAELNHIEWSYNNAIHLYGAAMLYNLTGGSAMWEERTKGLLQISTWFFTPYDNATNVMYERACEPIQTCNIDQFSFKGYLARFLWATTLVAPFTKETITELMTPTALAAAKSCSGGTDGVTCGTKWYVGGWDGTFGVGQQMSALEAIQGLLIAHSVPPIHGDSVVILPAPTTTRAPPPPPVPTNEPDPVDIASSALEETAGSETLSPKPTTEAVSDPPSQTSGNAGIKYTTQTATKAEISPTPTNGGPRAVVAIVIWGFCLGSIWFVLVG